MTNLFKFKQFAIQQDKTAMKIGTDAVLLGAWVSLKHNPANILDIGSGTGVISLMLAQRSNAQIIDAVELNDEAYIQTVENFEQSNWADRLFCYHASFQNFSNEINEKYNLIVSNPPFYTSTYKDLPKNRAMARHTNSLPYIVLLENTAKLLSKNGLCAFIVPFIEEVNFIEIANTFKLYPNRITRVKGNANTPIKRSLLEFSFSKNQPYINELILEKERHIYTTDYIDLVKNFYLKL